MEIKYYPKHVFGYYEEKTRLTIEFEDGDRHIEILIDSKTAKKLLQQLKKEIE